MARIMLYVRGNSGTKRWEINISRVPISGDYIKVPNGFAKVKIVLFIIGDRDIEAEVLANFEKEIEDLNNISDVIAEDIDHWKFS